MDSRQMSVQTRPSPRRYIVQKLLLSAAGVSILLGVGTASAQGLPPGTVPPVYGSTWGANQLKIQALNASGTSTQQAGTGLTMNPQVAKQDVKTSPLSHTVRPGG